MQLKLIIIALLLAVTSKVTGAEDAKSVSDEGHGLTAEFVYKYLVGEIAGQRGDMALASSALLDLAKSSRDETLAERATRTAIYGNQASLALQASTLWNELAPESIEANQALVQMLLVYGKLEELLPQLNKLLASETNQGLVFMYLASMNAKVSDKAGFLTLMQDLTSSYSEHPEAHFALASAAWYANNSALAFNALKQADQIKPGWVPAANLKGQMLQKQSAADALDFYQQFLNDNPNANELRLAYIRLLIAEKQFGFARAQMMALLEALPDNAEVHFFVAQFNLQMNDSAGAKTHLIKAIEKGYRNPGQAMLYLGQIAEQEKEYNQAMGWYGLVDRRDANYLEAQLRVADLLAEKGQLDKARNHLDSLTDITEEQRVIVIQTEANWLSQEKDYQASFELLKNTVETLPNSPSLIYDYAMAAEKIGQFDIMEQELRRLLVLKPDMGHAYNALGYSLADRNERLHEAQELIEKAMALNPDSHYILDSMGWLKYRMGDFPQALEYLRRAYAAMPDPEIAAHLGEVLWQQGHYEEAVETWDNALRAHPENEILRNTANKFRQ